METYPIRPARQDEFSEIRRLIRQVGINPTGLDWRRFVVAVDAADQMIGCGQIKPHDGGILELASIAVKPNWRERGVARAIIEHLLDENQGTLYLTCRARLGPLYERFGFRSLRKEEMPDHYRRLYRLAETLQSLRILKEGMLVMRRDGSQELGT
jgi:N-acetylglutamate synthase-like GNAT family acetyltransferase